MRIPDDKQCPIWQANAEAVALDPDGKRVRVYGSERAGGAYAVSERMTGVRLKRVGIRARARLTTALINQREQGIQWPEVTHRSIRRAEEANDLPVHTRAERLLTQLNQLTEKIGQEVNTTPHSLSFPGLLAWTESTEESEIAFLEDYLRNEGLLEGDPGSPIVSVNGYARISDMSAGQDSNNVFVAMWFDPTMEQVYEDSIKPAIVEAGYVPQRVGQGQTTDRIDYEAEAEIRGARLVIADFTHDDGKGVRGSVYYEAGFARALNKPIIFTAKEGSDIHFNVDHFLRIEWKDADDLRTQLTQRIRDLPELQR